MVLGPQISLHRSQQLGGRIRILRQYRLAPDDDELVVIGDVARGTNDVLKISSPHRFAAYLPWERARKEATTCGCDPHTRNDPVQARRFGPRAAQGSQITLLGREAVCPCL